jgi:hypothetical protein
MVVVAGSCAAPLNLLVGEWLVEAAGITTGGGFLGKRLKPKISTLGGE